MKKLTILAITTMLAAFCVPALAATPDSPNLSYAFDFYRLCSKWVPIPDVHANTMSRDELLQSGQCLGFAQAALDGVSLATGESPTPLVQWPERFTYEQAAMITLNYVRQHPEEGSYPTVSVMLRALKTAYPVAHKK